MFLFRRLSLFAASVAVVLSVILPVVSVSAQTAAPVRPPLNLMTSPLPLNVVTKPGQTVTADIRVKNNSTRPEQLKVELLKFGAAGDTGRPQLQEREPQDLYFNWVSFSETNFNAEPNVWKTIKMTVKTPKEAAFGYYFAVLFTRAVPDRPTDGASGVEGGVASLVLLNVDAPGAKRQAEVAELIATQKVYEFLPATFKIKLRNSGNVHVAPAGSLFIKRGDTQVATLNFNEERGNILPGTNRTFEIGWEDGFPVYVERTEEGKKTRTLKWDYGELQKLRFGKYTATLVAVYDDGQRDVPVEAVVSFWVIPWRILGVIFLILLLVGAGVWAFMRFVWRNIKRQAGSLPSVTRSSDKITTSSEPARNDIEEPDPSSLAAAIKSKKNDKRDEPRGTSKRVDQPNERNEERQKDERRHDYGDRPVSHETEDRQQQARRDKKRHSRPGNKNKNSNAAVKGSAQAPNGRSKHRRPKKGKRRP